jgi:beta-glucosidase
MSTRPSSTRGQPAPPVPPVLPPNEVDDLLTDAAASSFVLLKNDRHLLPLDRSALRRVAVVGPNAARPCYQGGGSAELELGTPPTIVEAIRDHVGPIVDVVYEPGCGMPHQVLGLHLFDVQPTHQLGAHGVTVEYYPEGAPAIGEPVTRELRNSSQLVWLDGPPGATMSSGATVRVSAVLTPADDGVHTFALRGSGSCALYLDGNKIVAFAPDDLSPPGVAFNDEDTRSDVALAAHRPVLVEIEMAMVRDGPNQLSFGCVPPQPSDTMLIDRATRAAADADVVVLVVGTTSTIEAEGSDRATTTLPGRQDTLTERVLDANPNTVVVVNAGAAVDLPWADDAHSILYTWLPGQAFGPALADVLTGVREPSGRLPITIARRHDDYPAWDTTPDADVRLDYTESIFVGYRHFDRAGIGPQFCFGHGLGYGDIRYERMDLSSLDLSAGMPLSVTVAVHNSSSRKSKEIVQVYVHDVDATVPRPPRELKAFAAVELEPGQTDNLTITLDSRAFAFWDDLAAVWTVEPGLFEIQVGRSSRDIRLTKQLTVRTHG